MCSLHTISDCLRWTRTHNLQELAVNTPNRVMSNEKSGRTGKFCVAAGCMSTHKDNLSLHEFPKENVRPNIRRQWIKFVQVKRKDFIKPTANSVSCEKHFPPGSYPVEYELKKAMNLPVDQIINVYNLIMQKSFSFFF